MDSPMEALVLNCAGINLGFLLRSFCSWFAVVAAALSFWRIRTAKPNLGSDPDHPVPAHHHPEKPQEEEEEEAKSSPCPQPETREQKPIVSTSGEWEEDVRVEMVTKGNKYKAYYDYQMKEGDQGDWQMVVEQWGRRKEVELQQQVQMGMNNVRIVGGMVREMGWYRYQDLKVLDGSVVRLWDNGGLCTRRR